MVMEDKMLTTSNLLSDNFYGVTTAKVTNVVDKENLGRIEVSFEFLLNKKHIVTAWARMATLTTGKDYGSSFRPAIGNEVLVTFINGCVSNSCIIGVLNNGIEKPLEETKKNKDLDIIKSSTGGALIFDDKESICGLEHEKSKLKIHLKSKDKTVEIFSEDGLITIKAGKDITIETKANIKVTGKDISVVGEGELNLEGSAINIKSGGDLSLEGKNIKSTASASSSISGGKIELEGKTALKLKGQIINMN